MNKRPESRVGQNSAHPDEKHRVPQRPKRNGKSYRAEKSANIYIYLLSDAFQSALEGPLVIAIPNAK
eukprot:gene12044-8296_t